MPNYLSSSGPVNRSITLEHHNSSEERSSPSRAATQPHPVPEARQLPALHPARATFAAQASNAGGDSVRETLPPINFRETLRDVEEALHNADMALRNAREAFRSAGTASQNNVVDLTNVSSDGSTEDTFMIQTRHPQDTNRGRSTIRAASSFNEPTFGPRTFNTARGRDDHSAPDLNQPHSLLDFLEPNFIYQPIPPPFVHSRREDSHNRRADDSAVRRQAQARRSWARVERRNRERAERQAQRDAQGRERGQQQEADTTAASDPGGLRQRSRRSSIDSNAPSISDISEHSLSSSSAEELDVANPATENMSHIDPIDLTAVDDSNTLTALLAKEQQDAISAQNKSHQTATSSGRPPTALSGYRCAICMDSPTHATTTICGHLFCHRCIMDSLKWSEQLRRDEIGPGARRNQGLCPVCRKPLLSKEVSANSKGPAGGLVGLEIKKVPRKQYETQEERQKFFESLQEKGKQRAETEEVVDLDAVKGETEGDQKIEPLGRGPRRKRKREGGTVRSSASDDSLFGSP